MDEVRGAVYGIADKCWCVGERLTWDVGFFADEGVGGVGFLETRGDQGFDSSIGFGDEVCGLESVSGGMRH